MGSRHGTFRAGENQMYSGLFVTQSLNDKKSITPHFSYGKARG